MADQGQGQPEALVIGGGVGGYVCAIKLGQLGVRTAIVERRFWGGVCPNVGCIPSKAVISAAHLFERMKHADRLGITCSELSVDLGKVRAWKRGISEKLRTNVEALLKGNKVETIRGEARFTGPQTVEVKAKDGTVRTYQPARGIVVATGARNIDLPGFDVDEKRILSYEGALDLERLPERLLVIGGGVIGLELGMAYAKLGSKLVVVELLDSLLPGTDPDLVRWVVRKLRQLGAELYVKSKALGWQETGKDGKLRVAVEIEGKEKKAVDCDAVLVSVGFRSATEGLGLEAAGVATDKKGFVKVDKKLRTNVEGVYAVGDVCGPPFLAHRASKQGFVAAEVIAGEPSELDYQALPAAIFTDPEIATVGLTEQQAREQGYDPKVGKFPFAANGRALTLGEEVPPPGQVKVVADRATGLLLGVHVVGPEAATLIAEATLAIEMGASAEDIALTIHTHPTLPEALPEAAEAAVGKPLHVLSQAPPAPAPACRERPRRPGGLRSRCSRSDGWRWPCSPARPLRPCSRLGRTLSPRPGTPTRTWRSSSRFTRGCSNRRAASSTFRRRCGRPSAAPCMRRGGSPP